MKYAGTVVSVAFLVRGVSSRGSRPRLPRPPDRRSSRRLRSRTPSTSRCGMKKVAVSAGRPTGASGAGAARSSSNTAAASSRTSRSARTTSTARSRSSSSSPAPSRGGLTWTPNVVAPIQIPEPGFGGKIPEFGPPLKDVPALTTPLNFADPNTILHFSWGGYLYCSTDRGVTWKGPLQLPMFDVASWQLRTDYLVEDKNTVLAFWSGSKVRIKRNENGGMVYMVKTSVGGRTWSRVARVSREARE